MTANRLFLAVIILTILLAMAGCASGPVTYATGDCMEERQVYKYGDQVAMTDDGEPLYAFEKIEETQRKVRCPGQERPIREHGGNRL